MQQRKSPDTRALSDSYRPQSGYCRLARQVGVVLFRQQAVQRSARWIILALWTDGMSPSDPNDTHHHEPGNHDTLAELHHLTKVNEKGKESTGDERTLPPSATTTQASACNLSVVTGTDDVISSLPS
jgi:hypothetical protein